MRQTFLSCLVFGILLFSATKTYCRMGTLYLNNGNTIKGDIRSNTDKTVTVYFEKGSMKFNSSEIKKIKYIPTKLKTNQKKSTHRKSKFAPIFKTKKDESKYDWLIIKYAYKNKISPSLVKAVIKVESNFAPKTVSKKGAKGLMQLMPETARKLGVTDIYSPEQNIRAGTKYLGLMLERFNQDIDKALAAYNAGPSAVSKHDGVPPYPETKSFVQEVQIYFHQYKSYKRIHSFIDKSGRFYSFTE